VLTRGPIVPDAIRIEQVTKRFGRKIAVDRLDLRVEQRVLYGFIGPNGAGKTTTIRIIMSIIFPDSGRVSVLGQHSAIDAKDRIGYLPEERGVYRKMKVAAFLAYVARLKGHDGGPALKRKIRDWLERVDLADSHGKRCEELSKGMQQKVQFLSTILHEPDLLILDEPFSGLDPVNTRLMQDLFLEQHRLGRTIIFSTHAMHQAEQLCDRIVMISNGRKVLDDTLDDIHARYQPHSLVYEPMNEADESAILALRGVRAIRRDERAWEIDAEHGAELPSLMQRIIAVAPARSIAIKRPTLEDIFIDIVGRTHAAPSNEPAAREVAL